jgi:hypothetical protein
MFLQDIWLSNIERFCSVPRRHDIGSSCCVGGRGWEMMELQGGHRVGSWLRGDVYASAEFGSGRSRRKLYILSTEPDLAAIVTYRRSDYNLSTRRPNRSG